MIDSPQQLTFSFPLTGILSPLQATHCRVVIPFKAQTQFKLHGVFPFPGRVVASFNFQNFSGPSINADYQATNADIGPTLGRDLAGGLQTVSVPLVPPQTLFEPLLPTL